MDRLFPDLSLHVQKHQAKQPQQHDTAKPLRSFMIDDLVYVKDFSSPTLSWIPGKVVNVSGPLSYHVELQSGRVVRRHVDAVRKSSFSPSTRHILTFCIGMEKIYIYLIYHRHTQILRKQHVLQLYPCRLRMPHHSVINLLFVDLLVIAHHLIVLVTVSEGKCGNG